MNVWRSPCGLATLYCADNLDVLPTLELESVHAIVTDPPYGISDGEKVTTIDSGAKVSTMDHEWDREVPLLWFSKAVDALKPGGSIIWWTSREASQTSVLEALLASSCGPLSTLFWEATQAHMNPRKNFGNAVEVAVFARKSGRVLCWNGGNHRSNLVRYRRVLPGNRRHPTQKPIGVMMWCLEPITNPDFVVLDPFMGSGSTGVAAIRMGRHFIGIEREKKYFDHAVRRIAAECEQGRLW